MSRWHSLASGSVLIIAGASALYAPRPTIACEGEPVKEASDGVDNTDNSGFTAARERFTAAAEAARAKAGKAAGGEMNIYPREPGDHYDRKDLGALRTGDLMAFKATADRQVVLQGFAAADDTALLSPGLAAALQKGTALSSQSEPGLARLFAAAKLGDDGALSHADLLHRIKFLFPFAAVQRLCPIEATGDTVQVRWQLKLTDGSPNTPRGPAGARGTVKTHQPWLTALYDRAAGTVKLSTGDEGC